MPDLPFTSVDDLQASLRDEAYLADRGLTTAIYLSLSLGKPLLLEEFGKRLRQQLENPLPSPLPEGEGIYIPYTGRTI